jgi:hypothetical protein
LGFTEVGFVGVDWVEIFRNKSFTVVAHNCLSLYRYSYMVWVEIV